MMVFAESVGRHGLPLAIYVERASLYVTIRHLATDDNLRGKAPAQLASNCCRAASTSSPTVHRLAPTVHTSLVDIDFSIRLAAAMTVL
jgi:hypothetical protein